MSEGGQEQLGRAAIPASGPSLWTLLFGGSNRPAAKPVAAPTSVTPSAAPTPTPVAAAPAAVTEDAATIAFRNNPNLELGRGADHKEARKAVQRRLIDKGFLTGAVDGNFVTTTPAAIIAFQKANNLTVTGTISQKDFAVLSGVSIDPRAQPLSKLFPDQPSFAAQVDQAVQHWKAAPALPGQELRKVQVEGFDPVEKARKPLFVIGWPAGSPASPRTPAGARPARDTSHGLGGGGNG